MISQIRKAEDSNMIGMSHLQKCMDYNNKNTNYTKNVEYFKFCVPTSFCTLKQVRVCAFVTNNPVNIWY